MEWSEELSGGLLQAAPDPILVLDEGSIVLVNDRAEEVLGWPRQELLGRRVDGLLVGAGPVLTPAGVPRDADRRGSGTSMLGTVELRVRRRDGTDFPAEISLSRAQTPQGRFTVVVVRDVAERHRVQAERRCREVQEHRRRRLEALEQLAGGIAHDVNNMLGVIANYATFVIEEAEAPTPDLTAIATDARQISRAGQRGTDLTRQLLKFARREVVRPQVLDLDEVVAQRADLLRGIVGDQITLLIRPAGNLPPVTCDPGQIEQLLVNLAVNARDAMPDGGDLVIDTAGAHLRLGDHPELLPGDHVRLRVSDSGRGMPPDAVERAFEPLFSTKAGGEGAGLGLATVYGIVIRAGGSINLISEPGLGTTVTVLLPADAPEDPVAPAPEAVITAGRGETLLVVEHEAAPRDVAGRILSGAGYHVLTAEAGAQALELAAAHEGAIDLLLSEVRIPGMPAKELADRLVDVRPDTRVLYMSGYAQPVLASRGALDPGAVLLEKPFTAAALLTAVRRHLDG